MEPNLPIMLAGVASASAYLNMSVRTLRDHLNNGTGPSYYRLSPRKLLFSRSDLDEWLKGLRVNA